MSTTPIIDNNKLKLGIIGMPLDLGGAHRGVDMGPYAVRHAGLMQRLKSAGHEVRDFGNIHCPGPSEQSQGNSKARFLPEIADASKVLSLRTQEVLAEGYLPLIVGGDHAISIGSIAGVSAHYHRKNEEFGVLWVDAHGDLNTPETSPSGNIHGMPLAVALGFGAESLTSLESIIPKSSPDRVALIGVRDLDPKEIDMLINSEIAYYSMVEIDEFGVPAITRDAIRRVTNDYTRPFHLSLDMDVVDPRVAPGVGTPVIGGLTIRESHYIMEVIAETKLRDGRPALTSIDLVEVNPILDEQNKTAILGVDLITSALAPRKLLRRSLEEIEGQGITTV